MTMRIANMLDGPVAAEETIDANAGQYAPLHNIDNRVAKTLKARGIEQLYQHQANALASIREGHNVILSTPTASGKSLVYTIPALERALEGKRTLYIAPMRALINDQADTLQTFAIQTGLSPYTVQPYTGQRSQHEKRTVRDREPNILLTTIDMVHLSLLPYATQATWSWLFDSLDLIVVDELHQFRGVFGSHVALIFRRLNRIIEKKSQNIDIIACSATIGNPEEHAQQITGHSNWKTIQEDTSSSGRKHWTVADNNGSPHTIARTVMEQLVRQDIQTLAFTRARQTAERLARQTQRTFYDDRNELAESIKAYHAALNDDERSTIEEGIQNNSIKGIWSTNALELGIDIGSLDAVILDGYPGSRMQAQQQAGRAGRGKTDSHVLLVPGSDKLDQYIRRNPNELFGKPETAQVNPANKEILPDHLGQAAREQPLSADDKTHFPTYEQALQKAVNQGIVEKRGSTYRYAGSYSKPFSIRSITDRTISLITTSGENISSMAYSSAINDVYPSAIYLHNGKQYRVEQFDKDDNTAILKRKHRDLSYYTKPQTQKRIDVHTIEEELENEQISVFKADVTVHGNVTGYYEIDKSSNDRIASHEYNNSRRLPFSFRTEALGFNLHGSTPDLEEGLAEGLHAAEHAMIGVMPLHVLCDRKHDLGGLSTPMHPFTDSPTIFIHEGHQGGVGLVSEAFKIFKKIVKEAKNTVEQCKCDNGCDGCIYSPTCGNANNVLDKEAGRSILTHIIDTIK